MISPVQGRAEPVHASARPAGASAFRHDGGETIFSLPNGFQGYYLSRADGARLDKGPTQIVRDPSRRDLAVTNGISCMGCHDQGMRKAKDEVRDAVLADLSFTKPVRDEVALLYPETAQMNASSTTTSSASPPP